MVLFLSSPSIEDPFHDRLDFFSVLNPRVACVLQKHCICTVSMDVPGQLSCRREAQT